MSTRTPLALAALIAAALALSGCAAGSDSAGPSDAASGTVNPTPTFDSTPSPSGDAKPTEMAPRDEPSPSAESDIPIASPGCDRFLTDAQNSEIASEGYVPDPTSTWPAVMAEAEAAGGTWCAWKRVGGDEGFHAGLVAIPDSLWQAKRSDLLAQGALEDDASYPGFIALPDEGAPDVDGGFVYANGYLVYVSYPKLAASVSVLQ